MAKQPCDARRCRQEASIGYVFGSNTYHLCEAHHAAYCDMPGTDSEGNIRKVVK